ncbi:MAG: hypothetical protein KGH72_03260 [Candidatus Micrarchaeota archaeon]|nr:hypothetical protein [Candidatus Micrarchaeota archaeon]
MAQKTRLAGRHIEREIERDARISDIASSVRGGIGNASRGLLKRLRRGAGIGTRAATLSAAALFVPVPPTAAVAQTEPPVAIKILHRDMNYSSFGIQFSVISPQPGPITFSLSYEPKGSSTQASLGSWLNGANQLSQSAQLGYHDLKGMAPGSTYVIMVTATYQLYTQGKYGSYPTPGSSPVLIGIASTDLTEPKRGQLKNPKNISVYGGLGGNASISQSASNTVKGRKHKVIEVFLQNRLPKVGDRDRIKIEAFGHRARGTVLRLQINHHTVMVSRNRLIAHYTLIPTQGGPETITATNLTRGNRASVTLNADAYKHAG